MSAKPNTARWTVEKYLEELFIPTKMAAGILSQNAAGYYRTVYRAFAKSVGEHVLLREVDDNMLTRFQQALLAKRYNPQTARAYVTNLRIVLRHWRPEEFPKQQGGQRKGSPPFIERDIVGTLEQIFCDVYKPERTSISSPATVRQYGRSIRLFSIFLGHPATPEDLTDRVVARYLRWLVEVEGVKPTTANGYVKQIKAMWNWLAKKKIVDEFPTIDKLKTADNPPVAWTKEELHQLLLACRAQVGFIGPVLKNLFWLAFYHVLWDTGERTGAMLALKWEWLDWKSGHLTVPAEFRKGRQQSMIYKLKPETLRALRAIAEPQREVIFYLGDSNRKTFYYHHKALIKSSGLPYVKQKCGPQKMRRTFASYIESLGGNATKALKHRDRRVTEDSYLDPRITEVESENLILFPIGV